MQIRRSIYETSSSSSDTVVVVCEQTRQEEIHLEQKFDIARGSYEINWDGAPHIYLTDWRSKLSFLLSESIRSKSRLRRVVKRRTGQSFRVLCFWRKRDFFEEKHLEGSQTGISYEAAAAALAWCSRVPEREKGDGRDFFYLDGGLCAIGSEYDEGVLLLPEEVDGSDYGLVKMEYVPLNSFCYPNREKIQENLRQTKNREELDDLCEEFLFNDSFGINLGGDAYCYDFRRGVPGRTMSPVPCSTVFPDAGRALREKNYAMLQVTALNGNELLMIGWDGTKLRIPTGEESLPEYPETIDLKVTDQCWNQCGFCYEDSSPEGKNGRLEYPFIKTIPSFVEIAVGGGNPLAFPDLDKVSRLTDIVNITLHERDWLQHISPSWNDNPLENFRAVGVSLTGENTFEEIMEQAAENGSSLEEYLPFVRDIDCRELWEQYFVNKETDIVFHIVNGVAGPDLLEAMYDRGLKILILGFKDKGRGTAYMRTEQFQENAKWLYDHLGELVKHFQVVAFDTLALEQLKVKRFVSDSDWEKYYLGDDGSHSIYIDLVRGEFGISSTDSRRWPVMDDIRDMFRFVRQQCGLPVWRAGKRREEPGWFLAEEQQGE